MTATTLFQQAIELLAREKAHRLSQQWVEVLAREPLVRLEAQALETLSLPVPDAQLLHHYTEVLAQPVVYTVVLHHYAEVLWREPATPDIFPWQHNWTAEVKERLEYRTDVLTNRSAA